MSAFSLPVEILSKIQPAFPIDGDVYLVGGAVRDSLLARPITDLDFTLPNHAINTARRVANHLKAAFYPLDISRDIGRVIVDGWDGKRWTLDFAAFQGQDLEADLRNRDFTVNAIALSMRDLDTLIDPLGGSKDLLNKNLHICSNHSFIDDPIRIPRAFRQASDLDLTFSSETKAGMHTAIPNLDSVSPDRLRDELFRIFEGGHPASVLRGLDVVGALKFMLPEVNELKSVAAAPPHNSDAFSHSLDTVQKLHQMLEILSIHYDLDSKPNWITGYISVKLGRYRQQFDVHLKTSLVAGRSLTGLLLLSALYHDVGKPAARTVDEAGNVHFYQHENIGAQSAYQRARILRLSRSECDRISCIVKNHMRPIFLAQAGEMPSRRSIYKFYQATGETGVDICLLSLADSLATYGTDLPQAKWIFLVDVARTLLEGWWEQPEEVVSPPILINGYDLLEEFQLKPGPLIGRILSLVREAQASGEIQSQSQALDFAHQYLQGAQNLENDTGESSEQKLLKFKDK